MDRRTVITTLIVAFGGLFTSKSVAASGMDEYGSANPPATGLTPEKGESISVDVQAPEVAAPGRIHVTAMVGLRAGAEEYGAGTLTIEDADTGEVLHRDDAYPSYEPGDSKVYTAIERGDVGGNTLRFTFTAETDNDAGWRLSPSITAESL